MDRDALPEWLHDPTHSESQPARPQAQPPYPAAAQPPPSLFDGASLVDEAALPDWLRSRGETEPLPLPFSVSHSLGTGNVGPERGEKKRAAPAADAGNADAADDEALPEWLQQVYSDAHVPPLTEENPPGGSGPQFSAADLVDARSVPTWLQEAAQTSPLPAIGEVLPTAPLSDQIGARGSAQPSLFSSASRPAAEPLAGNSLVDAESLPAWLRDMGDGGMPASLSSLPSLAFGPGASREGGMSEVFSATELVDTQALPAWLKAQEPLADQGKLADSPENAMPSGSASGIFSATELVDTQALPAWLKAQEPFPPPSAPSGLPEQAAPSGSASGIFSAAELVDTQALPAWLKTPEPGANPASGSLASGPLASSGPLTSGPLTSGPLTSGPLDTRPPSSKMNPMPTGFSAAELVDTKALPVWMKQAAPEAAAGTSQGGQSGPMRGAEDRMAAAELVDTSALPVWLKGAEGAGTSSTGGFPAFRSAPAPAASSEQTGGFSAASLVDSDALPEWLRPAQSGALSPQAVSGASMPGVEWGRDSQEQSGFSAASLIDPNELPEWMRGQEGVQRPGAGPAAGEAEETPQARIPHRPRLPTEPDRAPSQAAASVFSAVLGPTAGEDQRDQFQGGRGAPSRPMPALERGITFGGLPVPQRQAQDWGSASAEMSGWNQPPGGFEQGRPVTAADWQEDFDEPGMAEMPGGQRGQQAFQRGEPGEVNAPPNRQAGRAMPPSGFGMPGAQGDEPYGGRGFGAYSAGQPGRGAPGGAGYRPEDDGWEGGPGYGYSSGADDEAGPPSGMFAKLKRMLGFGRQ